MALTLLGRPPGSHTKPLDPPPQPQYRASLTSPSSERITAPQPVNVSTDPVIIIPTAPELMQGGPCRVGLEVSVPASLTLHAIIVLFGSEGHVALDRNPGPGYDTLLLQMIPGDLLSACPHRQFHTLPGLIDSLAALSNSYPSTLCDMQGGTL